MLRIDNVHKQFRGPAGALSVLDGVTLDVNPGEFVALMGPSGSGKSTLLLISGGLLAPTSGSVSLADINLYGSGTAARADARSRLAGFVFQEFYLVPYLNVLENVLTAAAAPIDSSARRRADELIARFGLTQRIDHLPSQLSAGEQQRAALARALINQPRVLLADEPTGNLDEENARVVLDHLKQFADGGGAVLLVTHDSRAAARCGRVIRLENGRVAA